LQQELDSSSESNWLNWFSQCR